MSGAHTPGLLAVTVEVFDNDGCPETAIQNLDGSATVAVALDFGANNPGLRGANAARIVACWNALADLPQDALDGGWTRAGLEAYGLRMAVQRDELLAALEASEHMLHKLPDFEQCKCGQCDFVRLRDSAIAKARGAA